jgi:hypothetical protein
MSRIYSVSFSGVAVTAQQDFFEITAAAGKNVRLRALYLSQSSDVGDAAEEGLSILIKSGATTSGSGGTGPTPVPMNVTDAAAGFAAEVNNTTKATSGTIVTHHSDNWNIRIPYQLILPSELCVELTGSRRATVELATTPADSLTISGTLYCEEFG